MKCSIKPMIQEVPELPLMRDLPAGTLFMPLPEHSRYKDGPGLITEGRGTSMCVTWLGWSGRPCTFDTHETSQWEKHVRVLEPGETVVLENN